MGADLPQTERTYPYEAIGLGGEFIPYVYCRRGNGYLVCSVPFNCGGKAVADEYCSRIVELLNRFDAELEATKS